VLLANVDVKVLRQSMQQLAQAESDETFDTLVDALLAVVVPIIRGAGVAFRVADSRGSTARAVARADQRERLAAVHPVLYRLDPPTGLPGSGPAPEPTDLELVESLTTVLSATWAACATVGQRVAASMVRSRDDRFVDGPSAALGQRLASFGMQGGGDFIARFAGKPLGPWEFQTLVAEAVNDLVGPGQSLTRQAVRDVYLAADSSLGENFAEAAATTGALITLHLVAPPIAVAADVVLASKAIIENVSGYLRDRDAYLCALNPSDSLGVDPSAVRLALQCAGEIAGAIPGGKIVTTVSVVAPLSSALVP
jgi:hypothetical protein